MMNAMSATEVSVAEEDRQAIMTQNCKDAVLPKATLSFPTGQSSGLVENYIPHRRL
jgi:hypothetical protein